MCEKETCPICLDEVRHMSVKIRPRHRRFLKKKQLERMGEKLKCGHIFHQGCIKTWFMNLEETNSDTCPMCRQGIRFSNQGMINRSLFLSKQYQKAQQFGQEDEYSEDDDLDYETESDLDELEAEIDLASEDSWEDKKVI